MGAPKRGHLGGVVRSGGSYRAIDDNEFVNPYGGGRGRLKFTGDPMKDPGIVRGMKDWTTNPVTGKRTMSGAEFDRAMTQTHLRTNQIIGPTFGEVSRAAAKTRLPSSKLVSTGGYTYDVGLYSKRAPNNIKNRGR